MLAAVALRRLGGARAAGPGIGLFDEASSSTFKVINYRAAPGQTNNVSVQLVGTNYIVTDSAVATIADGDGPGGCEQNAITPNEYTCPDPNVKPACWDPDSGEFFAPDARIVRRVQVDARDGNDTVTLDQSVTADLAVLGGDGNDRVNPHQCASFSDRGQRKRLPGRWRRQPTSQFGGDGNDEIHPGLGDDYDITGRFQGASGGLGQDTLSYAERTDPAQFVKIDMSIIGAGMGTTGGPCKVRGGPGFRRVRYFQQLQHRAVRDHHRHLGRRLHLRDQVRQHHSWRSRRRT